MNKKQFRGEYLAPKVKVVVMQARQQMLAGSGDPYSLDEIKRKDSDWDD